MTIEIRSEMPSEFPAIEALIARAFLHAPHTSHTEQFIVNALRKSGQLIVSLIAKDGDAIVGHVAVSPVSVSNDAGGWYGLGPISVAPERQGEEIGSQLMRRALDELRKSGAAGCVVLGEPGYYGRFGFKAEPALVFPGVPGDYFQAILFGGTLPAGTVSYHEAFNAEC